MAKVLQIAKDREDDEDPGLLEYHRQLREEHLTAGEEIPGGEEQFMVTCRQNWNTMGEDVRAGFVVDKISSDEVTSAPVAAAATPSKRRRRKKKTEQTTNQIIVAKTEAAADTSAVSPKNNDGQLAKKSPTKEKKTNAGKQSNPGKGRIRTKVGKKQKKADVRGMPERNTQKQNEKKPITKVTPTTVSQEQRESDDLKRSDRMRSTVEPYQSWYF